MSGTGSVNYQPLIQTAVGGHMDITQEYLKSILHYNPFTGVFTWKTRSPDMCKSDRECKRWNVLYANTVAGSVNPRGYLLIRCAPNGIPYSFMAHRLAFLYMAGNMPTWTDHINGNRTDNRWINLRDVDKSINHRNKARHRNNTSGETGIRLRKSGKWVVVVCQKHIGYFSDINDAIIARDKARATIGGFTERHGI